MPNPLTTVLQEEREKFDRNIPYMCTDKELPSARACIKSFLSASHHTLLAAVLKLIDGFKVIDPVTGKEKPHEDSCCNETLDDVMATVQAALETK